MSQVHTGRERTRELLKRTLGHLSAGNALDARRIYPQAMGWAQRGGDVLSQLHLLRLCRHFLEPDTACRHLAQGLEMARENGLLWEEAFFLNNFAFVCMELGRMEEAVSHGRACFEILEAHDRARTAVPLNNLGFLALSRGDLDEAGELLGRARKVAMEPRLALAVRSNLAVVRCRRGLREEAVSELRLLRQETACLSSVQPAILFNLARVLLEAGRAEEALEEAVTLPPWLANDEPLARAALASLRLRAYQRAGRPVAEKDLYRQARLLQSASHPQAWVYRTLWSRGDIHFLEEFAR